MRSIAYYWKEGLRNIFKHGFMSVAAVVIMVVSLLLTGTVTLVAYNITNNITRLQQSNQIVVWIDDSLTTREAKTLQTQFEKIDNIASIAFEDRDVALEQYRKELGDDADILDDYNADNNPLRNSYVFTLSDSMQADATIKEIEAVDGVASVRADEDVIRKLIQIQRVFNMIAAAMIVGLAVISIFIISNTVKLAMFARREEISIQKMVGATNWFIRGPFLAEGIIIGMIAAAISSGLISLLYYYLSNALSLQFLVLFSTGLVPIGFMSANLIIIFTSLGISIGAGGSIISMRKFLDA